MAIDRLTHWPPSPHLGNSNPKGYHNHHYPKISPPQNCLMFSTWSLQKLRCSMSVPPPTCEYQTTAPKYVADRPLKTLIKATHVHSKAAPPSHRPSTAPSSWPSPLPEADALSPSLAAHPGYRCPWDPHPHLAIRQRELGERSSRSTEPVKASPRLSISPASAVPL